MICIKCGNTVTEYEACHSCGTDLRPFKKAAHMANAYYNDGLQKAEVRNLSGAVISLKTALKLNKHHIDARNLLGLVYYEMGETVDALSEWVISKNYEPRNNKAGDYLEAIQHNQGQLDAVNQTIKKYNQAINYCKQDSKDLAIIQLKKVLALNPKLIKGHQLLALLYMEEGKYEQAKKALRNAGKIDTDNTTTLRYLKEVNLRLRESSKKNKPKNDDLISYQSGNEMIIMPKRFKESSLGATLVYIIIGLVIGTAVTCSLVVPGIKRSAQNTANQKLLEANDTITTNNQTIKSLNAQIEELKGQVESANESSKEVEDKIKSYEKLLEAYDAYANKDMASAGEAITSVDEDDLGKASKIIYESLNASIGNDYLDSIYNEGYSAYSSGDYETAIKDLQKIVDEDKDYEDGAAVYYLAQSYRRNGDDASAKEYYQYVIDNYPGTERANTAEKNIQQ